MNLRLIFILSNFLWHIFVRIRLRFIWLKGRHCDRPFYNKGSVWIHIYGDCLETKIINRPKYMIFGLRVKYLQSSEGDNAKRSEMCRSINTIQIRYTGGSLFTFNILIWNDRAILLTTDCINIELRKPLNSLRLYIVMSALQF